MNGDIIEESILGWGSGVELWLNQNFQGGSFIGSKLAKSSAILVNTGQYYCLPGSSFRDGGHYVMSVSSAMPGNQIDLLKAPRSLQLLDLGVAY